MKSRQVALERGRGHQQVVADQPGDRLRLGGRQAEARARAARRPRRPAPNGRRRGPWRCRGAGPRRRATRRDTICLTIADRRADGPPRAARARSATAGRWRGWCARRRCNGGTCRTASARRRGRNRERSGRTRPPRSSSAAPARGRAGRSARPGTARWRADRRGMSSISFASRAAARIASGWTSSPCASASANSSIRRTGSSAKKSSRGSARRPRSRTKPFSRLGRRRIVGRPKRRPRAAKLLVEMRQEDAGQVADRLRLQEIDTA